MQEPPHTLHLVGLLVEVAARLRELALQGAVFPSTLARRPRFKLGARHPLWPASWGATCSVAMRAFGGRGQLVHAPAASWRRGFAFLYLNVLAV